jgi:hypothetical protein
MPTTRVEIPHPIPAAIPVFGQAGSEASDGLSVSSPVARYRPRSSFRVRTAQFRAYRRPPNWRRRHAACSWVQSSANVNACTVHPSGTMNLATGAPGHGTARPRAPGQHPDAGTAPAPGYRQAPSIPPGYDIPPLPGQPARPDKEHFPNFARAAHPVITIRRYCPLAITAATAVGTPSFTSAAARRCAGEPFPVRRRARVQRRGTHLPRRRGRPGR